MPQVMAVLLLSPHKGVPNVGVFIPEEHTAIRTHRLDPKELDQVFVLVLTKQKKGRGGHRVRGRPCGGSRRRQGCLCACVSQPLQAKNMAEFIDRSRSFNAVRGLEHRYQPINPRKAGKVTDVILDQKPDNTITARIVMETFFRQVCGTHYQQTTPNTAKGACGQGGRRGSEGRVERLPQLPDDAQHRHGHSTHDLLQSAVHLVEVSVCVYMYACVSVYVCMCECAHT